MTPQDEQALANYQTNRELNRADIGNLTYGIRDNARDVCDAFWKQPERRSEFGPREIRDIREAVLGLWTLLREIERQEAA